MLPIVSFVIKHMVAATQMTLSMKMYLCLQLVELNHVMFKIFHEKRYMYYTKTNLERAQNSISLNFM
jgi:hypothetical protein